MSANLAGVELEDLRRGVVLAAPGAFATERPPDRAAGAADRPLRPSSSGDRLSFHHYSSRRAPSSALLDGRVLRGGESGRVQLRLSGTPGRDSRRPLRRAPSSRSRRSAEGRSWILSGRRCAAPTPELLGSWTGWMAASPEKLLAWVEQARESGAGEEALAARAGVSREEVRSRAWPIRSRAGRAHALRRSPNATSVRTRSLAWRSARVLRSSGAFGRRADRWESLEGHSSRGFFAPPIRGGPKPWKGARPARRLRGLAGEEARIPGREELAGAERELSARVAEAFRRRGLDPPLRPETSLRKIGHHSRRSSKGSPATRQEGPAPAPAGRLAHRPGAVEESIAAPARHRARQTFDDRRVQGDVRPDPPPRHPLLEHLDAAESRGEWERKGQILAPLPLPRERVGVGADTAQLLLKSGYCPRVSPRRLLICAAS